RVASFLLAPEHEIAADLLERADVDAAFLREAKGGLRRLAILECHGDSRTFELDLLARLLARDAVDQNGDAARSREYARCCALDVALAESIGDAIAQRFGERPHVTR